MARRSSVGVVTGTLIAVALAGCGVDQLSPTSTAVFTTSSPTPRQLTRADANQCAVTQPGSGPPELRESLFGWGSSYGNGDLWVGGLWPDGVIAAGPEFVESDGSIGMKFGWWRIVTGDLTITGRRLDASAPPLRADVPSGYGQTGFQASGVIFPTEGCWEVTGEVGTTNLSFVTFVIKEGVAFADLAGRPLEPPSILIRACPVGPVAGIDPLIAPASGTGPIYAVLGAADGRLDIGNAQPSLFGRYQMKTLWVATDPVDERILLRVLRLDALSPKPGFATGQGLDAEGMPTQLRLGPEGSVRFGGGSMPEGWRAWSSGTLVPNVGCYAFQIDTARGTQSLVFEVVE